MSHGASSEPAGPRALAGARARRARVRDRVLRRRPRRSRGRDDLAKAYGLAHRGYEIPNEVDTRFAIASGVEGPDRAHRREPGRGRPLELSTPARSLLGADLPLIDDDVTVEHLLAHRSGIGDYLDEDVDHDIDDYVMPVPVHELATTEQYLAALDGHPPKFAPDERFSYCNGGFVVLALIAERASGVPFHELVSAAGLRAGRHARHGVLALGRASGRDCARVPRGSTACRGRTSSTCRCEAAATAASTRPSPTSGRSGRRSSRGGSCRDEWVAEMVRAQSDAAVRGDGATASGSGSTPRPTRRDARGHGRRSLVPVGARPPVGRDPHRRLEHERRSVARHAVAGGATRRLKLRAGASGESTLAHGDVPSSDAVRCPNICDRPGVRAMWTSAGQSE